MPTISSASTSSLLHACALILIYSVYSLLQEKIMKTTYGGGSRLYEMQPLKVQGTAGPHQLRFTSPALLVFSNRLLSLCIGVGCSLVFTAQGDPLPRHKLLLPKSPASPSNLGIRILHHAYLDTQLISYVMAAGANLASTYCQHDALRYVGFTTQALAKCAKMVEKYTLLRIVKSLTIRAGPCTHYWTPNVQEELQGKRICKCHMPVRASPLILLSTGWWSDCSPGLFIVPRCETWQDANF